MQKLFLLCCLFAQGALLAQTPEEAKQQLVEGNKRFVAGTLIHPDRDELRRHETAVKQTPFAVIVGCSDSRVAPEIIFDSGIGDLFVVRVAGNVVGPLEFESIKFSVTQFNSVLVLVLGHKNCGALNAVIKGQAKGFEEIERKVTPAIDKVKNQPGDMLENAIIMNVELEVEKLKKSPVFRELIEQGKVNIIGGYYHLETGEVELLK